MAEKSAIEWTDATWNLWYGCTKVSPGCAHCYIERTPPYRMQGLRFERGKIPLTPRHADQFVLPLRWRKPRRIFVNSLTDTFHEDVPFWALRRLWNTMALAEQHTFQVLTKRPARAREFLDSTSAKRLVAILRDIWQESGRQWVWPLPNVWLGTTVENQRMADIRIPELLATPAAVRFLSCEPLLGPLDLTHVQRDARQPLGWNALSDDCPTDTLFPSRIDWVIAGGESAGPRERALVDGPFDIGGHPRYLPKVSAHAWVTSIRDQCVSAGVPFFFKQWGGPRPKSGGRRLEGREWNEMPIRSLAKGEVK